VIKEIIYTLKDKMKGLDDKDSTSVSVWALTVDGM
jgi:hypothetical protein